MLKTLRTTSKECHDCGQIGPEWCSINHGTLLCDECCSVHLNLGPHVSQIKSFQRSRWSPHQLKLINELSSNGANLIWEYSLRDPQNKYPRKKPSAKDPLPIKADFIRAKYQQLTFINRLKDETNELFEDLNLQLHSIVRTDNILTCLRFLSQGAEPNYQNPETGTSSVHVAASRGQHNQIELLCIYGGDPAMVDAAGISPYEHARINGYFELADRLVELQYELTDRLTCFIGGKRPDHKINHHVILPDLNPNFNRSQHILQGRQKLEQLPEYVFEELAMDVFDEIERRELKRIWYDQVNKTLSQLHIAPFLPVNPTLSATRNQGRQKLARFTLKDFHTLIYDILNEFCRRYHHFIQKSSMLKQPRTTSSTAMIDAFIDSDDELVYDKVASDEETENSSIDHKQPNILKRAKKPKLNEKNLIKSPSDNTNLSDNSNVESTQNFRSDNLKSRLMNNETQMKYLVCAHNDLKSELSVLYQMIQRLINEKLLDKIDEQVLISSFHGQNVTNRANQQLIDNHSRKSSPFIESDYDNAAIFDERENIFSYWNRASGYARDKRSSRSVQRFPQIDENCPDHFPTDNSTDFLAEPIEEFNEKSELDVFQLETKRKFVPNINRSRSFSERRNHLFPTTKIARKGSFNQNQMKIEVDRHAKKITQDISQLFILIQENQIERYPTYAQQIYNSVVAMISLIERPSYNPNIQTNINILNKNIHKLLRHSKFNRRPTPNEIQCIIDDCYNIALATKTILCLYERF